MEQAYGGYRLVPGFKLPPLMFTEAEVRVITLALMAVRSFRLDRLSDITRSDEHFVRPANFDAARHLQDSLYKAEWRYPVSVLLRTDMNTVTTYMGTDTTCTMDIEGMFEQQENGVLFTTSTDNYHWFAWWLAQLPFGFVIQSPDELKAALNEHIQRLLAAV